MRDLTPEETAIRTRRREGLQQFLSRIQPGLEEFVRSIVVDAPDPYLHDLRKFLSVLEGWLRDEDVSGLAQNDRLWLQSRVAYFLGQLLRDKFDAVWILDEDPASKFFLRYVMGYFKGGLRPGLVLDPFSLAEAYLQAPPPRSLIALLDSIEDLKPVSRN